MSTRRAVKPVNMLASCLKAEHNKLVDEFILRPLKKPESLDVHVIPHGRLI